MRVSDMVRAWTVRQGGPVEDADAILSRGVKHPQFSFLAKAYDDFVKALGLG